MELFLSGAARMTLSRTVTGVTTCYQHLPQTYSTELELNLMANSKSTASNKMKQNQILHFNFYSSGKLPLLSKSTASYYSIYTLTVLRRKEIKTGPQQLSYFKTGKGCKDC